MPNLFEELLTKGGLYNKEQITKDNMEDWMSLLRGDIRINCYCTECKDKRVFFLDPPMCGLQDLYGENKKLADYIERSNKIREINNMPAPGKTVTDEKWSWRQSIDSDLTRIITLSYRCAMNDQHRIDFFLRTDDDFVEKVGQKPSVADLTINEFDAYKKVLDSQSKKELRRAIGLYAQGIGIGAYVYLRRIFEKIINQAKENAIKRNDYCEKDFINKNMEDTISLLKEDLPEVLVDNKVFYKIVSKGIHELSEEECIQYFPVLRDAITAILSEWQRKKEEQDNIKSLSASLNRISSQIQG